MRIRYRVVIFKRPEVLAEWASVGLNLTMEPSIEVVFVNDNDERLPKIAKLSKKLGVTPTVVTEFTNRELNAATWLNIVPIWHHGYPQPESGLGHPEPTYDRTLYCNECGTGAVQIGPFMMSGEPKWGTRSILQLNWVFDEYFVKPEVYHDVLEPLGIGCRPVLRYRDKTELKTVLQIAATEAVDLDMEDLPFETCKACDRKKYDPRLSGFYPKPNVSSDTPAIIRSIQWFGGGHSAFNRIMIANRVYQRLNAAKIKGVDYKACKQ